MANFWTGFGEALGKYEARKSPLGAAVYGGVTGKSPFDPNDSGDPNNPYSPVQQAVGRYRQSAQNSDSRRPTQPVQPGAEQNAQNTNPRLTPLKPVDTKPVPLNPDAGSAHEGLSFGQPSSSTNINVSLGRTGPAGTYGSGGDPGALGNPGTGGILSGSWWDPFPIGGSGGSGGSGGTGEPSGSSSSTFTPDPGWWNQPEPTPGGGAPPDGGEGTDNLDGFARGGMAAHNQFAKVAESGPEVAGGKIVTSPMIVSLKKGETVIPLTPNASNKMSPDMLEGHLAQPKVPGMGMARYQRYGQGRGLMR